MAKKQTLDDYLKRQEACWDARIPPRLPYVVRLDGRGFHRLSFVRVAPAGLFDIEPWKDS